MKSPPLQETAFRDRLRTGLGIAIAEARMVRSLIENKTTEPDLGEIKKLVNLEREIDYLETTLFELRSEESR